MRRNTLIIILIIFVFNFLAQADLRVNKELMLFGGWKKSADDGIYDKSVSEMGDFFSGSDYHLDLFFGGNDLKLTQLTEEKFDTSTRFFSAPNFNCFEKRVLDPNDSYFRRYKSGDQVLIIMDNHGSSQSTQMSTDANGKTYDTPIELTHGTPYALSSTFKPERNFSMDRLESIVKEMTARGVKVGIVDTSCYSGHTQKLAKHGACVISATVKDAVSYPEFKNHLFANFKKGLSLEEIYLRARRKSKRPSMAEISTEAGNFTVSNLTDVMLGTRLDTTDDLEDKLDKLAKPENQKSCSLLGRSNIEDLQVLLATQFGDSEARLPEVVELAEAVAAYDKKLKKTVDALKDQLKDEPSNTEEIPMKRYMDPQNPDQYETINANVNWDTIAKSAREDFSPSLKHFKDEVDTQTRNLKKLLADREDLERKATYEASNQSPNNQSAPTEDNRQKKSAFPPVNRNHPERNPSCGERPANQPQYNKPGFASGYAIPSASSLAEQKVMLDNQIKKAKYDLHNSEAFLNYFESIDAKRKQLLNGESSLGEARSEAFRKYLKKKEKFHDYIYEDLQDEILDLVEKERAAFDVLYKARSNKNQGYNSCREFKL